MTIKYGNLRDTTLETTNWLLVFICIELMALVIEFAVLL